MKGEFSMKSKHYGPRELAAMLGFPVVGKLKRLPDVRYGMGNARDPLWVDEAGNEYNCGLRGDVCPGCIVDSTGRIY